MPKHSLATFALFIGLASTALAAGVPGTTKIGMHTVGPTLSAADLLGIEAEYVRAYPNVTVYRIPTANLSALARMASSAGAHVDIEDWDKVILQSRTIDTRTTFDHVGDGTPRLYIVQFVAPLADEDDELLRANGVEYLSYLPQNAALVLSNGTAIAQLKAASQVQWVSTYDKPMKPSLSSPPFAENLYTVQFANTSETADHIADFLAQHTPVRTTSYLKYTNVTAHLQPSEAAVLLDDPFVVTVEHAGQDRASGEREAISLSPVGSGTYVHQENVVGSWQPFRSTIGSYRDWVPVNASTYRIAIADSGIRRVAFCGSVRHPDLQNVDIQWGPIM